MRTQTKTKTFGHAHDQTGGIITVGRFKPDTPKWKHGYFKLSTRQVELRLRPKGWTYLFSFTLRRRDILGWDKLFTDTATGRVEYTAIMRESYPTVLIGA